MEIIGIKEVKTAIVRIKNTGKMKDEYISEYLESFIANYLGEEIYLLSYKIYNYNKNFIEYKIKYRETF